MAGWPGLMQISSVARLRPMDVPMLPAPIPRTTVTTDLNVLTFWLVTCLVSCPRSSWAQVTYAEQRQRAKSHAGSSFRNLGRLQGPN